MTDRIHVSRVALALGLGLGLAACSTSQPLSKSYGVATKANMQAQIVPVDPATIEDGPIPSSGTRAAAARDAYDSGQVSDNMKEAESTSGK